MQGYRKDDGGIHGEELKEYKERDKEDKGRRMERINERMERIQGVGWRGYLRRRVKRIHGEGWRGSKYKDGEDTGRRVHKIFLFHHCIHFLT